MSSEILINFTCTEETMGPRRDPLYIVIPVILIYVLIFVTGTVGNISTCIVISKNKSMHTATNYYLFSLAISDLLLLTSGLPQEIYLIWSRYPYIFGSVFCFLRGLFSETSANATVLTITAFTIERYLAICHPFLSQTMSKLSRAVKLILIIWLIAVILAVPQAMQLQIVGEPDCELCYAKQDTMKHAFEISTFLFFVTPMTLITVLYALIGLRLKSSSMMNRKNTNVRIQSKSSKRVVKMLVAVVVAFFICWAPFHAQRLYSIYWVQPKDMEARKLFLKIYEIVTYISGILYYVSATINPILYNIMSVKFREAFKETFTRWCCLGVGGGKRGRPERSYSVLSRTNQRGVDSTDSNKDEPSLHNHTTLTHKSSLESFVGYNGQAQGRRYKTSLCLKEGGIEEENFVIPQQASKDLIEDQVLQINTKSEDINTAIKYLTKNVKNGHNHPTKLAKYWRYLDCISDRNVNKCSRSPANAYYSSTPKEDRAFISKNGGNNTTASSPCQISNSSLKDVEHGALEDELSSYYNLEDNNFRKMSLNS